MTTLSTLVSGTPPWADIAASGLPVGTARVRLLRTWQGVTEPVRGASGVAPVGSAWRYVDYSMPVTSTAATVDYTVEPLSSAGATLTAGVVAVSLAAPIVDHSDVWVSDPLDPLGATLVGARDDGLDEWDGDGSLLTPLGGLPVSSRLTRTRGRSWRLRTDGAGAIAKMWALIDSGAVLLLRGDPACLGHPSGVVHLHAPRASVSAPRGTHDELRYWSIFGTECAAPALLVAVPTRTYRDTTDAFASYAATAAALPTYLARTRGAVA